MVADEAWYNDIENKELRTAYETAKKNYRALENEAFANGFGWICGRCGGSGIYTQTLRPGTCFNCWGTGTHPNPTPYKFPASPKTRLTREASARAKRAAEDAAFDGALRAIGGEVEQVLRQVIAKHERIGGYYNPETDEELNKDESFVYSLACNLRRWGALSPKQIQAIQNGIDRKKQRAAEAEALQHVEPLTEGRYEIEGEILTIQQRESDYGFVTKMLVKMDDGNKVWGTKPSKLYGIDQGARVKFTARITPSTDDKHFGFFSRPTKAEVLKEVAA